jgi:hypothetical protein
MNTEQANRLVASAISDAMAHCKNKNVDEQTLRTGLLTITLANFVNRIGKENTINLFSAIPEQIRAGTFDKYMDPNADSSRRAPVPHAPSIPTEPQIAQSYSSNVMPSNFIPPQTVQATPQGVRPEKRRLQT